MRLTNKQHTHGNPQRSDGVKLRYTCYYSIAPLCRLHRWWQHSKLALAFRDVQYASIKSSRFTCVERLFNEPFRSVPVFYTVQILRNICSVPFRFLLRLISRSNSVLTHHVYIITPRAHARSGVKQSVLSVSQSVSL